MTTVDDDKLPPPHDAMSPPEHRAMSERFLVHAQHELDAGRRLQASEKIWGAVAHQLAAIAEERGWEHRRHSQFGDIVEYLEREHGRNDLIPTLRYFEYYHSNFYSNSVTTSNIRRGLRDAPEFIAELEALRKIGRLRYKVNDDTDQRIIESLTGENVPKEAERRGGFINRERLNSRRAMWGKGRDSTGDGPSRGGSPLRRRYPPKGGAPGAVRRPPEPERSGQIRVERTGGQQPPQFTNEQSGPAMMLGNPKMDGIFDIFNPNPPRVQPPTSRQKRTKARSSRSGPRPWPSGRRSRR